jgi:preprotein translocase subunit SecG
LPRLAAEQVDRVLHTFLMVIHFFCSAAIIALVLLQRGKGAEAGAGFGAGASGTVFGARGASTALSRATAILAAIFMVTSLSLAYVGTRKSATSSGGVLDQFAQPSPTTSGPTTIAPTTSAPTSIAPVTGSAPPAANEVPPANAATPPNAAPAAEPPAGAPPK